MAYAGLEPGTFHFPDQHSNQWATEFDMDSWGKLLNSTYIIIIASLTLYPPVLIKNSTVGW